MNTTNFRKKLCVVVIFLTVFMLLPAYSFGAYNAKAPTVSGTSSILIDAGSGEVLYEKNADERRDPASVTKILNAMVVLDNMNLDTVVTIPEYSYEKLGNLYGIKPGEQYTVEDLLYAMMLFSSNDVAEALAIICGGDIDSFCTMMNDKAKAYGATDTNYTNPNGMNNAGQEHHKTTARDLSVIASEAMQNKTFRKIVKTKTHKVTELKSGKTKTVQNTNACLYNKKVKLINDKKLNLYYEGCNGIKTGLTSRSGECFVGSAKRGNTEFIAVVLNAPTPEDKYKDAAKLWDYGYANYRTYTAAKASEYVYELKVKKGDLSEVDLGIKQDMDITVAKGSHPDETTKVETQLNEKSVTAPVKKGTVMGKLICVDENGKALAESDLIALEDVNEGWILSAIGISNEEIPQFILIVALIISGILILLLTRKIRREKRRQRRRAQRERAARSRGRERERKPFDDVSVRTAPGKSSNTTRSSKSKRRKKRRRRKSTRGNKNV